MIVGCALGDLYTSVITDNGIVTPIHAAQHRVSYIILGITAMLASYTRMTFSLVVVAMETSMSINLFVPVTITVMTANFVGGLFNRSLYERAVRGK